MLEWFYPKWVCFSLTKALSASLKAPTFGYFQRKLSLKDSSFHERRLRWLSIEIHFGPCYYRIEYCLKCQLPEALPLVYHLCGNISFLFARIYLEYSSFPSFLYIHPKQWIFFNWDPSCLFSKYHEYIVPNRLFLSVSSSLSSTSFFAFEINFLNSWFSSQCYY